MVVEWYSSESYQRDSERIYFFLYGMSIQTERIEYEDAAVCAAIRAGESESSILDQYGTQ